MKGIGYNQALEVFEKFNLSQRIPSLHPFYILADSKRDSALDPVFWVYEHKGEVLYHGFYLSQVEGTEFFDIQSPYGYGGPIATTDDKIFLSKACSFYLDWCLENNILAEFIRFHPILQNWNYYNGEIYYDRQTVWIDLTNKDILSTYSARARTSIRKAIKNGLYVEWWDGINFLPIFSKLYYDSMKDLNADKIYYLNDEYFYHIINWKNAKLGVCRMGQDIVGAAIFLTSPLLMEYHLSAANSIGKMFCAHNLLIHEAALLAQTMGCTMMHLGGGTNSETDNPLLFFKSSFSKLRAFFKNGRQIHHAEKYLEMQRAWEEGHSQTANRVLFYRF